MVRACNLLARLDMVSQLVVDADLMHLGSFMSGQQHPAHSDRRQ